MVLSAHFYDEHRTPEINIQYEWQPNEMIQLPEQQQCYSAIVLWWRFEVSNMRDWKRTLFMAACN